MKKKERIIYLDLLRIFSIFAMMLLHVAASNWGNVDTTSFEWQVFNFYDSLVRFCVPVFVMISGVFFLDNERNVTVRKILTINIPRIITAFVFWSLSYSVFIFLGKAFTKKEYDFVNLIKNFLTGHYHMWFLFTIVCLYLIVPLLRKITQDKKMMEYFFVLTFIFCFCGNILKMIPLTKELYNLVFDKMNMHLVMGYSGYFILGLYLFKYEMSKKIQYLSYSLGIISLLFTIIVSSIISVNSNTANQTLYGYLLPNTLFVSIAVFVFFKYVINKINFKNTFVIFIDLLARLSFGMYLVHDFFNMIFSRIGISTLSYNAILSVPVNALMIFGLSFGVTYIINKIPILNKWIL